MYKILYNEKRKVDMIEGETSFYYNDEMVDFIKRFGGYTIEDANWPGVVYAGTKEEADHDMWINKNNPNYYEGECLIICKV